jgi:hypothetical protein
MYGYQDRLIATVVSLICLAEITGCSTNAWSPSVTNPSAQIGTGVTAKIEGTYATYGQWGNRLAVVVWSDLPAIRSQSGLSQGRTQFCGTHRDSANRKIQWQAGLPNEETGSIRINGQTFDLSKGRLLLATIREGNLAVQQMDYDIDQYDEDDILQSLQGWLISESEVREFFTRR